MTPIRSLIDSVVKCVKCGQPLGCPCWLTLKCPAPGCSKSRHSERQIYDPPNAVTMLCPCPDHLSGDMIEVIYLDAQGNEIPGPKETSQ